MLQWGFGGGSGFAFRPVEVDSSITSQNKDAMTAVNTPTQQNTVNRIADFYRDATSDYRIWSKHMNMHFGYWKPGMCAFRRERMLQKMNDVVITECCQDKSGGTYLDLGCGVGATVKYAMTKFPNNNFKGFTISPHQTNWARYNYGGNFPIYCKDYNKLEIPDKSADGAWFLESLCHAENKESAIKEVARVLKPGARLIICDGMRRRPCRKMSFLGRKLYRVVCNHWAVPDFPDRNLLILTAQRSGFKLIRNQDWSIRIGFSALHAPWLSLRELIKARLGLRVANEAQLSNLKASMAALFLGCCRRDFRYGHIVLEKV